MAYTIAFFGSKPYDEASFNEKNSGYGFELRYYKGHLNLNNVILTQGVDAVCIFVNAVVDKRVIDKLHELGIKETDLPAIVENAQKNVRIFGIAETYTAEVVTAILKNAL